MRSLSKVFLVVLLICYLSSQVESNHGKPGGIFGLEDDVHAEHVAKQALGDLACGDSGRYRLHKIKSGEKQVVAGIRYYLVADVACEDEAPVECRIDVVYVPWRKSIKVHGFECD